MAARGLETAGSRCDAPRPGPGRRRVLGGLAATASLAVAAAAASRPCAASAWAADGVVLQLRWDHQFQFAGYYAALWQGYYAEAGLAVEIRSAVRPDGTILNAVEEVGAGRADFGVGAGDILTGYDRGLPLAVLASVFQKSPVAFFARAETRLETPADLMRLRVGRWPGDEFVEVELQALLRAEGLDPAGLARVDLAADAVATFLAGDPGAAGVDVLPGTGFNLPFRARELGVAVRRLRPESFGIDFYGDSLFAHERTARARPDLAQRFTDASLKGWAHALRHVDDVARRIVAELPQVNPARDPLAFNLFQAAEVGKLALSDLVRLGNVNPERWRRMHEEMARSGMVSRSLDLERFDFDPERLALRENERLSRLLVGGGALLGAGLLLLGTWAWSLRAGVRRATLALRRSEERYRALVETSPDAIMVNHDGAIAFANPQLARLLGARGVHELIGRPVDDIVDEEARPALHAWGVAALERGEPEPPRLLRVRRLDGRVVETEPATVRVDFGGQPAVQVVLRDLTERRRAERAIESRNRALEVANRELEQFASVAAHDLRAPLRHVSLLVGWLEEELGPQLSRQAAGYMDQLRERASRVSGLIGGLRQYALAGSRNFPVAPIDLAALARGVVELLNPPPGFRFELDLAPAAATVVAAEPPLALVLRNLVANALRHHDRAEGLVRVRAWPAEDGGGVEFAVEDDGPGIDPHRRDQVFDMFVSFAPLNGGPAGAGGGGDGLGLALVRRTVTAHGGRIWLEPPPEGGDGGDGGGGRGTTVRFTWPEQDGGMAT